jgi:predicted transcriptional regulator of viral defense system
MDKTSIPTGRQRLTALIQRSGDTITVDDAVASLSLDRRGAAKILARWREQGWLRRISRGVYVPAAMDTLDREQVLTDPWVLIPALFGRSYVGGRTAAEYWDLTEQIFRDIVVMTARPVRQAVQERHGAVFHLHHMPEPAMFGTVFVWRGQTRVEVSDVHRTVIDILADPSVGGGIDHVADCVDAYLKRDDASRDKLLDYGDRLGNSVVFKRLGYLLERSGGDRKLIDACQLRIRQGISRLDPERKGGRINSRWRLYIPSGGRSRVL